MSELLAADSTQPVYAPFGKRMVAFVLDLFVLGFVMLMVQFWIPYLAPLLLWIAYKTLFECSAVQATPGKRAMDLLVVDARGNRLTVTQSLIRTVIAWFSVITLFSIYAVALFTRRKQALHDMIADSLVVEGRRDVDPGKAWLESATEVAEKMRTEVGQLIRWFQGEQGSGSALAKEKEKLELLERLERLRAQGALTEEEYLKRKQEILS